MFQDIVSRLELISSSHTNSSCYYVRYMVIPDDEVHIWCMLSKGLNLLYVFVTYLIYVTLFYKFNYNLKSQNTTYTKKYSQLESQLNCLIV